MDFKIIFSKIYEWFKKNDHVIYLEYAFLALFVLAPLLKPGFVFALDMVFTPKISMPAEIGNYYLLGTSLHFLNYLIPSQVIQKILLFLVIFLAGIGMHRLVPTKSQWPKYFAGLLYIFNPFVYSRFLYGHLLVLLAYALLPWVVKDIFIFLKKPNLKNTFKLGLWFVLISLIDIHYIFFIFLFFAICWLFHIFSTSLFSPPYQGGVRGGKKEIFRVCKYSVLIGIIFFTLSSWWLVPFLIGKSPTSQFIAREITDRHAFVFQTAADAKYGVLFNTAAMYGFWGDREGRYVVQKDINPYWFELYLVILVIVIWGVVIHLFVFLSFPRKRESTVSTYPLFLRKYGGSSGFRVKHGMTNKNGKFRIQPLYILPMIIIGIISLVLAVGIAYGPFIPLIEFLNHHIPFYKGFREPQKWVALLVLVYTYLGALGVDDLIPRFQRILENLKFEVLSTSLRKIIPALFLIIPLLYSPGMIWGFRGQLYVSEYPESWYEANRILNQDQDNFNVLFFPWHQYLYLSFARRIIANPAPNFFDKPVIAGDNMEMGNIYTQSSRPESKYIEGEILARRGEIKNLGEKLLPLNIKYVILAQESDFFNYDFVKSQDDLELIYDGERIKIYRNKKWEVYSHPLPLSRGE